MICATYRELSFKILKFLLFKVGPLGLSPKKIGEDIAKVSFYKDAQFLGYFRIIDCEKNIIKMPSSIQKRE